MKGHYKEVEAALYLYWLIRQGKTVETISAYYHTDDDLKDAPTLEKILPTLEKQVDLFTEGEYQNYGTARKTKTGEPWMTTVTGRKFRISGQK